MKKLFLSLSFILVISSAFAQKSNVSKAENLATQEKADFNGAREAIQAALKDPSTMNDAKTYYVAGLIGQKENDYLTGMMVLPGQKVDPMQKGKAAMEAYKYFLITDSLDRLPDEKGKVKPKFTKKIKEALKDLYNNQQNLFAYGAHLYDTKSYQGAYNAFNAFLTIPKLPMMNNEIKMDTLYNMVKYYTAIAATNMKDSQNAIRLYKELTKGNYELKNVYQLLADEYRITADTVNYMNTLNEGFAKFKTDPWFLQNIINHYIYTKQIDKASQYLDDAIAQSPNVAQYHYVKGNIEERLAHRDVARAAFDKAIELDPNMAEAYGGIGRLIYNQGVEIFNKADEIKDVKLCNQERAKANEIFKQALPYLKKAFDMNPKDDDFRSALKQLYYRLDMQKEYGEI